MDAIEKSLYNTEQSTLVSDLYKGKLINYIECLECNNKNEKEEEFLDLPIQVEGCKSIYESLLKVTEPETMCGDNKYFCDKCKKKVDAKRGTKFGKTPKILTFSLLRYRYDWDKGVREKINDFFEFPRELDFTAFMDSNCKVLYLQLIIFIMVVRASKCLSS